MAASAEAQPSAATYTRRVRGVWAVLALSTTLFCAVCTLGGTSLYGFLNGLTRQQHAHVQLVRGTQLSVVRNGTVNSESVSRETSLGEGDEVHTGSDTEANVDLFDNSTLFLSFGSDVQFSGLHTGRFFGSRKDIALHMPVGTALFSTADPDGNSSVAYTINTDQANVQVEGNSTVRVRVADTDNGRTTVVAVNVGSAVVASGGRQVQLQSGYQTTVAANNAPTDPEPEVQELVRNGDFTQPATSKAEDLGAAWQPIIERSGDEATGIGSVVTVTEKVGTQSIHAARIDRQAGIPPDGKPGPRSDVVYGKVGIRQDIGVSVSYFHLIQLNLTVKVVAQTEPVGGPQEDVYPLTVKVKYTDSNNKPQEWWHSFYVCTTGRDVCKHENATSVSLGQYSTPDTPLIVKRIGIVPTGGEQTPMPTPTSVGATPTPPPDIGAGIAIIDAIEIYGIGNQFQSWVTDISLTAR